MHDIPEFVAFCRTVDVGYKRFQRVYTWMLRKVIQVVTIIIVELYEQGYRAIRTS